MESLTLLYIAVFLILLEIKRASLDCGCGAPIRKQAIFEVTDNTHFGSVVGKQISSYYDHSLDFFFDRSTLLAAFYLKKGIRGRSLSR